jgi:D-arabinose 1-dehydrogenase-like Zn-dependent alcohol dehydrogenase
MRRERRNNVVIASPMRTPMKAITQHRYGSADVLRFRDIDEPTPGEHEVLVRVQAAGIAHGVIHVMTGEPYLMRLMGFGLLKPKNPVLGQDVSGTVTATGVGVTRFTVGGEVFGSAKRSFADYAVAREDKLSHKPENLTFGQAAAMPVSGLTALRVGCGRGHGGSDLLVVGASGGQDLSQRPLESHGRYGGLPKVAGNSRIACIDAVFAGSNAGDRTGPGDSGW